MTDEENRLRDAVVEAAFLLTDLNGTAGYRHDTDSIVTAEHDLEKCVSMLRDYRIKASAPEPAPRVEPPEEFRDVQFHWLERGDVGDIYVPAEWYLDGISAAWRWSILGLDGIHSPRRAAEIGFRYHSPCIPRVQPTRQAIRDYARLLDPQDTEQIVDYTLEALAHFAVPARVQPTDEEIDAFNYGEIFNAEPLPNETMREMHRRQTRAILAHFSAPTVELTDEEIANIADDFVCLYPTAANQFPFLLYPPALIQFAHTLITKTRGG